MGQALNTNTNVEDLLQSAKQFVIKHEKDFDPMVNSPDQAQASKKQPYYRLWRSNFLIM